MSELLYGKDFIVALDVIHHVVERDGKTRIIFKNGEWIKTDHSVESLSEIFRTLG